MTELFNPFWCLSRCTLSYTERQTIKVLVYLSVTIFFILSFMLVLMWSFPSPVVRSMLIFVVLMYMPNIYTVMSIKDKVSKYPKLNPLWFSTVEVVNFKGEYINTNTPLSRYAVGLVWAGVHCVVVSTLVAIFVWDTSWWHVRVYVASFVVMYIPNLVRYSSLL